MNCVCFAQGISIASAKINIDELAHGAEAWDLMQKWKATHFVVNALTDALTAAQLSDPILATQSVQDDPDLFFRWILFAGGPFDVFDGLLARAFTYSNWLSYVHSSAVTKSQKHSLIKLHYLDP